jgi:Sugar (and other) transporter
LLRESLTRDNVDRLQIFLHWGANFTVSQTFPILLSAIRAGVVLLGYAAIGVAAFLFVQSLVTETKGRSLQLMETDLRAKANV